MMNRVGRDRGWAPLTRPQYEALRSPQAALMVGSVQQVIDKILYEHELFGNTRFLAQASVGNVPHKLVMKSIELFGTKVVPEIRKAVNSKN
jgi:alkanesulfonate monooxygenase SsuD/methylene tetrahydromethanopterin reductase-like flavin-dependent oxidoreductase (luciferase family)